MKPYYALIFTIFIVPAGCKTVKVAEQSKVKTDSTAVAEKTTDLSETTRALSQQTEQSNTVVKDTTAEKAIVTEYSKPDTAGKQHIVKQTVIEKNTGRVKTLHALSQQGQQATVDTKETTTEKSKVSVDNKTKTNITTTETKGKWKIYAAIIGLLALAGLVYRFRKSFSNLHIFKLSN